MAEKLVGTFGDAVTVYHSLIAVKDDPNAFAREAAKWAPEIVLKALKLEGGKAFFSGLYFVKAGIDFLNPDLATSTLKLRLTIMLRKMEADTWITLTEQERLRNLLANGEIGKVIDEIMLIKLQPKYIGVNR